ncbi:MAG: diguanylate cyclase [Rhodanobacter sp.]
MSIPIMPTTRRPRSRAKRVENAMAPKTLVAVDPHSHMDADGSLGAHSGSPWLKAASANPAVTPHGHRNSAVILLGDKVSGESTDFRDGPVVFLTAHAHDMDPLVGYRSGAAEYIVEPGNDAAPPPESRILQELYATRARLKRALQELAERNQQLALEFAERERREAVMRHQATHDPLTGLPNRTLFGDRLDGAIQRANRHQNHFAVAYIDIDGFKAVNDSYGHAAGDVLLQEIGIRLSTQLRANDTVARLGGDEFALVLEEVESPEAALKLCEKVGSVLAEPYELRVNDISVTMRIGASIGIAAYRPSELPRAGEKLMQAADNAMYAAKRTGKCRCVLAE